MKGYEEIKEKGYLWDIFGNTDEANFRISNFDEIKSGLDTWDFQWAYTRFINSGLSIVPSVNLVKNLGFGEDATHTLSKSDERANMKYGDIEWPLSHPHFVIRDKVSDDRFFKKFIFNRKNKIKKIIKKVIGK